MHKSVMRFVAEHGAKIVAPVLEVGSCNVNGSVRELCPTPYLGVDVVAGPGVDLVVDGVKLPFEDGAFATVVSTEMLEHALDPVASLREMVRVLRQGGTLLVTARGNSFPPHNPPDRWRLMPGTLSELLGMMGCKASEMDDPEVSGVFVAATKP